jgi:hypothetical protein
MERHPDSHRDNCAAGSEDHVTPGCVLQSNVWLAQRNQQEISDLQFRLNRWAVLPAQTCDILHLDSPVEPLSVPQLNPPERRVLSPEESTAATAYPGFLPRWAALISILLLSPASAGSWPSRAKNANPVIVLQSTDTSGRSFDVNSHPYLEDPLDQLVKKIPELKTLRPAPDQQALAMILQKTGERVDEFFANMVNLIAREEITQERQISGNLPNGMPEGLFLAQEKVRDDYLILRHSDGTQARISEFRIGTKGNRMDEVGLNEGFLVTSGFALCSVHFATGFQWDARFLYPGDQKIEGRDTYVVAFAQLPSEARNKITMKGRSGITVDMLTQGIAWVDKGNFHIVQMQTDLLVRRPEIGLDKQTTKVRFGEVRFPDVPEPLWLPRDVNVYIKVNDLSTIPDLGNSGKFPTLGISEEAFRNVHHYTNYRRYRVSAKNRDSIISAEYFSFLRASALKVVLESNGHHIHPLLGMERAKMRPSDKILSLVRIYLVESELVGDQFPILGNEVVGLSCLCV